MRPADSRPPGGTAQTKRGLTLVDLLNAPRLSDVQLSPDHRQVLYTLAHSDWKANTRISHVWRAQADVTQYRAVDQRQRERDEPRWSPDGTTIAFLTKRGGSEETQVYVIPNTGSEAWAITHHHTSVSRPSWSPDGRDIYFLAPDLRRQRKETAKRPKTMSLPSTRTTSNTISGR